MSNALMMRMHSKGFSSFSALTRVDKNLNIHTVFVTTVVISALNYSFSIKSY